jgi:hypothetical protein
MGPLRQQRPRPGTASKPPTPPAEEETDVTIKAENGPSEKDLANDLEFRLNVLSESHRCIWRAEVRMLCYTHAARGSEPETLRIDYIAMLDGILVGFEVKRPPDRPAELGRCLWQCAQYAQGIIGAATVEKVPQDWIGKALLGVFLVSDASYCTPHTQSHGQYAHRLYGPANVGFLRRKYLDEFELFLCADRAWSKEWGWHRGLVHKSARSGNGSVKVADIEGVTVPDKWAHTHPIKP